MLSAAGINNPEYEFKMSDIFGSDEKSYGQNLYLAMYQKVAVEPEQTALNKVAQMKGLSAEEASAVLNGSIGPLIQAHPKISQEDALHWVDQMQKIYQNSIDTASLGAEAEAEVMPTEIFANNDTSDSGFDLVADLNDIEKIMFMEVGPIDVNYKYSGGQPSKDTPKPQDIAPGPEPSLANPQAESGSGGGAEQISSALTEAGGIKATNTVASPKKSTPKTKIGPKPFGTLYTPEADKNAPEVKSATADQVAGDNACPSDPALNSAIDDYDQSHESTEPTLSSGNTTNSSASTGSKNGGNSGNSNGTNGNAGNSSNPNSPDSNNPSNSESEDIFTVKDIDPLPAKIEMAPAGQRQTTDLCPDGALFCVKISTHSAKYGTYTPSDPCIACHIEKMNEAMKKLNSRNLMPKKMTGNLMEVAKCKKGFSISNLLNINLITVAMPIKTPEGKEDSFGKNIMDEIKYFINSYTLFKVGEDFNKAAEIVDTWKSSATTQEDAYLQIEQMIQAAKNQAEVNLEVNEAKVDSYSQGSFFQQLTRQLEQMNVFFESFKTLIEGITDTCGEVVKKDYTK